MSYNPEIFFFALTTWSVCIWGMGWYFGYDRRKREDVAREIVDSLETVN